MAAGAPMTNWYHVASSAKGEILVATTDYSYSQIFRSTNFGITWITTDAPFGFEYWSSIACSADGTKMVAGEVGGTIGRPRTIYCSTNSGANWHPVGANGSAVVCSANGYKFAALEEREAELICTSTNSGTTWQSNNVPGSHLWSELASSADGTKLVAAARFYGLIYNSTNSGKDWRTNNVPYADWSSVASSADGLRLVAASRDRGIYTSLDGGQIWISNSTPATNWTCVASSADGGKLFARAKDGGIYRFASEREPTMRIVSASNVVKLSWLLPSRPYSLQQNSDLTGTNWVTLSNPPGLNLTNLCHEVHIPLSTNSAFYRLASP